MTVAGCDVPNHPNHFAHECDGRDPYERCSTSNPCDAPSPLHVALFGECIHRDRARGAALQGHVCPVCGVTWWWPDDGQLAPGCPSHPYT